MKIYQKSVQGNDITTIIESLTASLTGPSAIILMAPYNFLSEASSLLKEKYPDAQIIGTSGTTLFNGQISDKMVALTAFFDDIEAASGIIENVNTSPINSISSIEKNIQSINSDKNNTICIEFTTGGEETLVTTLNSALEKKNISLVGGSVFGYPETATGEVTYNGKSYSNSCAYILIKNKTGKIKVYKENLYEKTNHDMHYVTKSDSKNRKLIELDGKPALKVYCDELGIPESKAMDYIFKNPLGRVVGDEVYISSFASVNNDKSINMYKILNHNDTIFILDLMDYKKIIEHTHNQIKSDFSHISFILSVDCIYRYMLFDQESFLQNYVESFSKVGPHMGIIGGGEQYNKQHVNQTMVCVVFE